MILPKIFITGQVIAALAVALCSLITGYTAGYTSPALVSMTNGNYTSFEVTPQAASWVGGIMPLAGLAGGIAGGPSVNHFGCRKTIVVIGPFFMISWLLIAFAVNIKMVLGGRALSGFCVGIASLSFPVYLGEALHPDVRGALGLLPTCLGNIGIVVCFAAGAYLDWSELAFLGAALPIPYLILMIFVPETPRWYVSHNNEEKARKSLKWLRGQNVDIEPELKILLATEAESNKEESTNAMSALAKNDNVRPLLISLGLMFFQQLSGINAIIFYTVSIFKDAGSSVDETVATIIVGVVHFMATFVAAFLIDRLGRKILLYISNVAMIVSLFTLGGFFYVKSKGADISEIGWLPLAMFVIFVIGFSLGFGPIPWLMMGEILPAKVRGSAASVVTSFNWLCAFIVTKTFIDMIATIGTHGAFWVFGTMCIVGLIFTIAYVPETRGKTLEEIEQKMRRKASA